MARRSTRRRPAWGRKRWFYPVAVALIVVALVVVVVLQTRSQDSPGPGTEGPTATATSPTESVVSGEAVTLLEVVDGDTIRVGMPDGSEEKVRYIGIDAPEVAHQDSSGEYLGEEATSHNAGLLESGPLLLETDVEERDDFGRLLAYVWAGEVFINERMVMDGYAWAHNYPPNLTRQEQLWAAHDQAREAGIGVWAEGDH